MRPIVIGDALLRLAEKVACKQLGGQLKRHLMPHQVGVAVKGGLNMWATVERRGPGNAGVFHLFNH